MLLPNPPKLIFPIPMLLIAPMITIQRGRLEGKFIARSSPERIAEPSVMVSSFLPSINLLMNHSTTTQVMIDVRVTHTAPQPKKIADTTQLVRC